MENKTASAIISFAVDLEDASSDFYERLADKFAESKDVFQNFAKSCKKTKVLINRTYQENVSDILETGFSFEGLDLKHYDVKLDLPESINYPESLKIAISLEDKASRFYTDASKLAKSLLATIPTAFARAAEVRSKRKLELESLLGKSN